MVLGLIAFAMSSFPATPVIDMDKPESQPRQRVPDPAVPATPDGTPPYTDPLPTAAADAAAPDGAPRPTRPTFDDAESAERSERDDDVSPDSRAR